ncbi:MAG: LysE family translocator [Pseudomonadota bacterium]
MSELLTLLGILFVAMMSPGPDMILISRYALSPRPRTVFFCILGICVGLCVHIALALLGLAALIAAGGMIYMIAKTLGAIYLIYIGYRIWTATPDLQNADNISAPLYDRQAFRRGLLTNLLNPKVMIFILALFTQLIDPAAPPVKIAGFIGLLLPAVFMIWSGFALLIRQPVIFKSLKKHERQMNMVFGAILIGFGIILGVTP